MWQQDYDIEGERLSSVDEEIKWSFADRRRLAAFRFRQTLGVTDIGAGEPSLGAHCSVRHRYERGIELSHAISDTSPTMSATQNASVDHTCYENHRRPDYADEHRSTYSLQLFFRCVFCPFYRASHSVIVLLNFKTTVYTYRRETVLGEWSMNE